MRKYSIRKSELLPHVVFIAVFLSVMLFNRWYLTPKGLVGLIVAVAGLIILPVIFMWAVIIDETGLASGYCFFGRFKKTVQIDFENIASVRMGADKKSVFIYSTSNRRSLITGRDAIVLKENIVNRSELLGHLLNKIPASKVIDVTVYEKASGMKL